MEIAPESMQTLNDRRKVEERMQQEKQLITQDAIKEAVEKNNLYIDANMNERVCLYGDKNPADPSARIKEIAMSLGIEINPNTA